MRNISMKVIRAEHMGFCMGVRKAVHTVNRVLDRHPRKPVNTYGPLIHNPPFIEELREKGVGEISSPEEQNSGTVIIRAHGITPKERERLEEKGLFIIDATCPKVVRSQRMVEKYSRKGYKIVIVGDRNHGEVRALAGYARNPVIISSADEAKQLLEREGELSGPLLLIAQTTMNREEFEAISKLLQEKVPEITVCNSLCRSVNERESSLEKLSEEAEAVLVIGGRNSANTRNLFRKAQDLFKAAWHIETEGEIPEEIKKFEVIGITAGASTPDSVIDRVEKAVEKMERR
jgi:4-hydroxy-3-methylbut-2-enyl diphosphate reductase